MRLSCPPLILLIFLKSGNPYSDDIWKESHYGRGFVHVAYTPAPAPSPGATSLLPLGSPPAVFPTGGSEGVEPGKASHTDDAEGRVAAAQVCRRAGGE